MIALLTIATIFSACSDSGNKAKTQEAGEVVKVETHKTQKFTKVKPGSHIEWRASHLGGLQPRFGKIKIQKASFMVNGKELSNALVAIDMKSLTVENFAEGSEDKKDLTGHLLGPDFFNTNTFPTARFELLTIEPGSGKYNAKVMGNLTIMNVTKAITFNANIDVSDDAVSIKSEDFTVDRTDWGLTYHVEGSEGVPVDYLIADDIGFTIDVTVAK